MNEYIIKIEVTITALAEQIDASYIDRMVTKAIGNGIEQGGLEDLVDEITGTSTSILSINSTTEIEQSKGTAEIKQACMECLSKLIAPIENDKVAVQILMMGLSPVTTQDACELNH